MKATILAYKNSIILNNLQVTNPFKHVIPDTKNNLGVSKEAFKLLKIAKPKDFDNATMYWYYDRGISYLTWLGFAKQIIDIKTLKVSVWNIGEFIEIENKIPDSVKTHII